MVVGGLGTITVAGALVPLRGDVTSATIVLVLVVLVVGGASIGGPWAGASTAVIAALSFDFFFTRPYGSLTIASADDVETTILLLVSGVIVGLVSSWGRHAHRAAITGSAEIRRIHHVAEAVAGGAPTAEIARLAQDEIQDLLQLRECRFESGSDSTELPVLERNGRVHRREFRFTRDGFELPLEGLQLAVLARGKQVGRFVLVPTAGVGVSLEQRVVAVAIADQLGGALASSPSSLN